jgi:uncharacterized membrane protein YedE/YeeE
MIFRQLNDLSSQLSECWRIDAPSPRSRFDRCRNPFAQPLGHAFCMGVLIMNEFTPLPALLGGVLIGVAASALLALTGRIAGVSGIIGGLLPPRSGDSAWRAAFVLGLVSGGAIVRLFAPSALALPGLPHLSVVVLAGLLVGVGTRLGNGCTSGHGVCGISRGSRRSLIATVTFILTGVLTVWLTRGLVRGAG